ncbi:hypothetical protein DBT_1451 [Dissulfuribacter thermophilus]|uniref:Outer membrane protein beta-barrel domain-containing protein n=3 Tax=Dissulfuribacter thermophilus TaxID=1156395 RepID=A0A1B9F570_9BACT|nr:hypothetical protein DBT_1451 [Dissulfuribacter thermophilus]
MDYRTEAHSFSVVATYRPLAVLGFNANFNYTTGRGNITDLKFESMFPTGDAKLDLDTSSINPNQPYLYDVAYLNEMADYSNLDFEQLDFTMGVSYRISNDIGLGINYYYTDFEDNEAYVYGDQDVTVQSLMGFVTVSF